MIEIKVIVDDEGHDVDAVFEEKIEVGGGGGIEKETDPTVPDWAKQAEKPEYSYEEIKNTPTIPNPADFKEIVIVNILEFIYYQTEENIARFIDLSNRFLSGEIIIIGGLDNIYGVITAVNNQDDKYSWYIATGGTTEMSGGVVELIVQVAIVTWDGESFRISTKEIGAEDFSHLVSWPEVSKAVKQGLTKSTETWTDDEKASACETIGALKKLPSLSTPFLYLQLENGKIHQNRVSNLNYNPAGAMFRLQQVGETTVEPSGTTVAKMPKGDWDCTPKKYVDDLVGDIETALDNIIAIQNSLIGGEV